LSSVDSVDFALCFPFCCSSIECNGCGENNEVEIVVEGCWPLSVVSGPTSELYEFCEYDGFAVIRVLVSEDDVNGGE
jgi:hypothetical protein